MQIFRGINLLVAIASALKFDCVQAAPFGFQFPNLYNLDGSELRSDTPLDLTIVRMASGGAQQSLSFQERVLRNVLHNHGLHHNLSLKRRAQPAGLWNLRQQRTVSINEYDFQVAGFPVCGSTVKAIEDINGRTVIVGDLPQLSHVSGFDAGDWPIKEETFLFAAKSLSEHLGGVVDSAALSSTSWRRCLYNLQGDLEPVWEFLVKIEDRHYLIHATSNQVVEAQSRFFDATATVQAYDPNVVTGTLKSMTVPVDGSGRLTNQYLTTGIFTGGTAQTSPNETFAYTGKDIASAESSTFAYANQHLEYLQSLGYSWSGGRTLKIVTNYNFKGDVNQAFYSSADATEGPFIYLGTGDGSILQNIQFDADVVSHELTHHVVFNHVKSTKNESLVLHEGLADFFTFMRTGDACLAEAVCPTNGRLKSCTILANKCLRTADNTMKYGDSTYQSYIGDGHMTGQLISGFLWDIRKAGTVPSDTLAKYVLEAVTYLPASATVKNFVAALFYVDSLNSSTYESAIVTAADNRGLSPDTLGIDLSNLKDGVEAPAQSPPSDNDNGGGKTFYGCGTVTGSDIHPKNAGMLWLLSLVLPAFTGLLIRVNSRRVVRVVRSRR